MADRLRGRPVGRWRYTAILAASFLGAVSTGLRAAPQNSPVGLWSTEDHGGVIQIRPCGPALCGIIVGLTGWRRDGSAPRDVHGTSQCHLTLLAGLRLHPGDHRWHGSVTTPQDGRTYDAEVWVAEDGVLRLRGYIGLPILGSTQHWPAFVGQVQPDCHFSETPTR
jgi:uncharacterized protein (DUF2147 family)